LKLESLTTLSQPPPPSFWKKGGCKIHIDKACSHVGADLGHVGIDLDKHKNLALNKNFLSVLVEILTLQLGLGFSFAFLLITNFKT